MKWVSFGGGSKAQPDMQGNPSPALAKSLLVLLAGEAEERHASHAMPAALCCRASARSGVTEKFAVLKVSTSSPLYCGVYLWWGWQCLYIQADVLSMLARYLKILCFKALRVSFQITTHVSQVTICIYWQTLLGRPEKKLELSCEDKSSFSSPELRSWARHRSRCRQAQPDQPCLLLSDQTTSLQLPPLLPFFTLRFHGKIISSKF